MARNKGAAAARAKSKGAKAGKPLLEFDRKASELFRPYKDTTPVKTLAWFGQAGDQLQLRVLCGGVVALGLLRRDPRMIEAGARMLVSHEAATLAKKAVKNRVDRWRPRAAGGRSVKPRKGHSKAKELNSFPSGHSAGAMAVAQAAANAYPAHGAAIRAAGVSVGLVQVPTCAHYPSDVAAGLAIGSLTERLVGRLWRAARTALVRRYRG